MPFTHEKSIIISEAHLDSFGHVNNARYFELLEQARWDLITERGFGIETIRSTRTGPTILEINVRFLRELKPRDVVVIRTELISYERKIGKLRQQMIKDDNVACEAIFTIGLFDLEKRRLIEPTPAWAFAVGLEPPPRGNVGRCSDRTQSETVTLFILIGVFGRSRGSRGAFEIVSMTSMPSITLAKTGCLELPGENQSR